MRALLVLFLIPIFSPLLAQAGLHQLTDARSQAMAGSTVTNEGLFALYGNPAGLSQISQVQGVALVEFPFGQYELQGAGFGLAMPLENSALGMKAATYGFDAYRELQLSFVYSRQLHEQFSLGSEIIYWNYHIPGYGNQGFLTFALGMQAILSPSLKTGIKLYNPIRASVSVDEKTFSSLQTGLIYQASAELNLVAEVYKDIDFPAQFKAGIEYNIDKKIAMRLGLSTAPSRFSFGLGLGLLPAWAIDIAVSRHEYLGLTPGFSLRYVGSESLL